MWENNPEFKMFAESLDFFKDKKGEILGRFKLAWYGATSQVTCQINNIQCRFLSENTDIVLSHQVHNELNYLYLDALYAHYPLVHNSPYFKVPVSVL